MSNKVKISGPGLNRGSLNKESEFSIDCSKVESISPKAFLTNIFNELDSTFVNINQTSKNIFKCKYVTKQPGNYLMNVMSNDSHIGGSPFELSVGLNPDPSKVLINADEIKTGIFGSEIRTLIDTSNAGPGDLTASCIGPKKVAICKLEDKKNGIFLLTICPLEIGKHILQIKYNDEHISDGPFQIRIFGPPDATKVINIIIPIY